MSDIDSTNKQVTQWCGDECSCDLSQASVMTPFSWGYQVLDVVLGGQQPGSSSPPLAAQVRAGLQ